MASVAAAPPPPVPPWRTHAPPLGGGAEHRWTSNREGCPITKNRHRPTAIAITDAAPSLDEQRCLVLGASGYVGARLVPALLAAGAQVRVMVRDPDRLREATWLGAVEVQVGNVGEPEQVWATMADVDVIYYLIHSMDGPDFVRLDRLAAQLVARAAKESGVGRIVYLGGLPPTDDRNCSRHLASRAEVGEIFLRSGVPSAILQAGVIVGAGSTSFELLRHLTERLAVLPAPPWVHNQIQPIAIGDVLHYLLAAATLPAQVNRGVDIGGPDVMTYWDLMCRYARIAGLPAPLAIPLPDLPQTLSTPLFAYAAALLTPVRRAVAEPLIESLAHDMVCGDGGLGEFLKAPPGGPCSYEHAVRRVLGSELGRLENRPAAGTAAEVDGDPAHPAPTDPAGSGGPVFVERHARDVRATPSELWQVIHGIGGDNGWYTVPGAWRLRGLLDRLVGGIGAYRGRPDIGNLHAGDILDFWRVQHIEPGRRLTLRAEMKMPGTATLEMTVEPAADGGSRYSQKVTFAPAGPIGHLYWWTQRPAHTVIFATMARTITRAAERQRHTTIDPDTADR
ncbi:MAG: SDR family oxidoreductase [Actinomycetota bacterium]|nr:SDR family oxidoreductase [Actinomycetota bacterium]